MFLNPNALRPANFNPRTSNEVRLIASSSKLKTLISIHAPQTRCDELHELYEERKKISIHAPQTRCDFGKAGSHLPSRYFNPRTSNEVRHTQFNIRGGYLISIHAPQTRCDSLVQVVKSLRVISIHAPQTRCDELLGYTKINMNISIHAPQTRCDFLANQVNRSVRISIHAPQTRCDNRQDDRFCKSDYFNPRTSNEVRHLFKSRLVIAVLFQSTHLKRGATIENAGKASLILFQSTHLKRGATNFIRC